MATTTRTITIPPQLDPVAVLGPVDEVIREVERAFPDLTIIVRGNRVAKDFPVRTIELHHMRRSDLAVSDNRVPFTVEMCGE